MTNIIGGYGEVKMTKSFWSLSIIGHIKKLPPSLKNYGL